MSTGHVKVMLLLLGTVSFAAVWSNDQRPASPANAAIARGIESARPFEPETASSESPLKVVAIPPTHRDVMSDSADWLRFPAEIQPKEAAFSVIGRNDEQWVLLDRVEFVNVESFDHPLPRAIAPGVYRVIDRLGNVSTQSVTTDIALATGFCLGSELCDSYTARKNGDRWHFIRIETDQVAARDESNLRGEVRQAWKSMLRVLGAKTERPLRMIGRPLADWLVPEDLADDRSTVLR